MLTNEEVIEELLKIAREIVLGERAGESLNLDSEELAFYDALTKPEAVKDFYSNDQLIAITRELTDALRRNKNDRLEYEGECSCRNAYCQTVVEKV